MRLTAAQAWMLCSHLHHTEADALSYAWPPRDDDATRDEIRRHDEAGRAFMARAERAAGRPLTADDWRGAIEQFYRPLSPVREEMSNGKTPEHDAGGATPPD